ncbi:MAG TPA: hypothetical protein VLA56_03345, partial [Pseudomonadales bacterium]|nr:hypothetical protein [Pseudomonadales bacterium]
ASGSKQRPLFNSPTPFRGSNAMPKIEDETPKPDTVALVVGSLTAETLAAHNPTLVEALSATAREEGAAAERSRIQTIEGLSQPGLEDFIAEAKFDPAQTPEAVAVEALSRLKAGNVDRGSALRAEGEQPLGNDHGDETAGPAKPGDVINAHAVFRGRAAAEKGSKSGR